MKFNRVCFKAPAMPGLLWALSLRQLSWLQAVRTVSVLHSSLQPRLLSIHFARAKWYCLWKTSFVRPYTVKMCIYSWMCHFNFKRMSHCDPNWSESLQRFHYTRGMISNHSKMVTSYKGKWRRLRSWCTGWESCLSPALLLMLGYKSYLALHGFWGPELHPPVCTVVILVIEPSPQALESVS